MEVLNSMKENTNIKKGDLVYFENSSATNRGWCLIVDGEKGYYLQNLNGNSYFFHNDKLKSIEDLNSNMNNLNCFKFTVYPSSKYKIRLEEVINYDK